MGLKVGTDKTHLHSRKRMDWGHGQQPYRCILTHTHTHTHTHTPGMHIAVENVQNGTVMRVGVHDPLSGSLVIDEITGGGGAGSAILWPNGKRGDAHAPTDGTEMLRQTPILLSVEPQPANIDGGSVATFRGKNFVPGPVVVVIGSQICAAAAYHEVKDYVTCVVPAGTGQSLPVTISFDGVQSRPMYLFSYNLPIVSSVKKTWSVPGTPLQVTGTSFPAPLGHDDHRLRCRKNSAETGLTGPPGQARWTKANHAICVLPDGTPGGVGELELSNDGGNSWNGGVAVHDMRFFNESRDIPTDGTPLMSPPRILHLVLVTSFNYPTSDAIIAMAEGAVAAMNVAEIHEPNATMQGAHGDADVPARLNSKTGAWNCPCLKSTRAFDQLDGGTMGGVGRLTCVCVHMCVCAVLCTCIVRLNPLNFVSSPSSSSSFISLFSSWIHRGWGYYRVWHPTAAVPDRSRGHDLWWRHLCKLGPRSSSVLCRRCRKARGGSRRMVCGEVLLRGSSQL